MTCVFNFVIHENLMYPSCKPNTTQLILLTKINAGDHKKQAGHKRSEKLLQKIT